MEEEARVTDDAHNVKAPTCVKRLVTWEKMLPPESSSYTALPLPEVLIDSVEACLLFGQCSTAEDGFQIHPLPLNVVQIL